MSPLVALEVAYEVICAVRAPLARIAAQDAPLADQLRRAVQSVALNLAEGSGRVGRDRARFYRTAHGSHRETRSALRIAACLGYVGDDEIAAADAVADRLGALLWGLTR